MTGIILALMVPLVMLLWIIVSGVVCLVMIARAHGNIKNFNKKQKRWFLFFGLSPILLIIIGVLLMILSSNQSKKDLQADIESGAIKVYTVSSPIEPSNTQQITMVATSSAPVLVQFDIFAENLYAELSEFGDLKILTNEFDDVEQIRENNIAFINLTPRVFTSEQGYESYLKKEHGDFKKLQTAIGTLYEYEDKNSISKSGRFMWDMRLANRDDDLLISVSYRSEDDNAIKRAPVISRDYAKSLYDLVTSTLNLKFIEPISDAQAI